MRAAARSSGARGAKDITSESENGWVDGRPIARASASRARAASFSAVSPTAVGGGFFKWGMLVQRGVSPGAAASITTFPTIEDAIFFALALPAAVFWTASRPGYAYVAPRWVERNGQWYFTRGAWARHDKDHDGVRNGRDADRDGDGVPNWVDRRPNNDGR